MRLLERNNNANDKKSGTSANNTRTQAAISVSPSAAISVVNSEVKAFAADSTLITDGAIEISAVSNEAIVSLASGILRGNKRN